MFDSLRSFVNALAAADELARIDARVSPVLEIAGIADRVSKAPAPHAPSAAARRNDPRFHHLGGRALLFSNVDGSDIPVLINAYGSYRRTELALGCHDAGPGLAPGHTPGGFDALGAKIGALVKPEPPRSLREAIDKARQFLPLLRIAPKRARAMGPCQEVIHLDAAADLTRLPVIRCWPLDGDLDAVGYPAGINAGIPGLGSGHEWDTAYRGRYITLAGIHTIHADDLDNPKPASHNIGMYRVQILGKRRAAMHWHMHHDGARHWRSWKAKGEPMPVAIALGGESVLPYAATAPLPPGISELLLAGFLNRGGIPLCRARTVPLWVPANAEIIIEGYVSHEAGFIGYDPRDPTQGPLGPGAVFEGPFGDHTGFYSMPDRYPILEVTAITHRRDPIYPTTIVGLPPQEDYYLGKATERVFLPLLRTLIPDIEDYDLPMFGAFHNAAFLRIHKHYPLQGRRVMHSVWGAGQMAWTKSIFVVDHDVDVHDTTAVLRRIAERCRPGRDTECVNGPLDILDHAAPRLGAGMKVGFDGTIKRPAEEAEGIPVDNDLLAAPPEPGLLERVRALPGVVAADLPESCGEGWLFVACDKRTTGEGMNVLESVLDTLPQDRWSRPAFVIVVDQSVDVRSPDDVMFHWCANTDASRDMVRRSDPSGRCVRLGFDATPKRPDETRNGQPVRDWPPIIRHDPDVARAVAERWSRFGLPG